MKTDERPEPEDTTEDVVARMVDSSRSIAVSHVVFGLIFVWVLGACLHECAVALAAAAR